MKASLWISIADVADWCLACLLEPPRTFPVGMFPATLILSPYQSWHGVLLSWCGTLLLLSYCICGQTNFSSSLRSLYMAALPCVLVYWLFPPCFVSSTNHDGCVLAPCSGCYRDVGEYSPYDQSLRTLLIASSWLHCEPLLGLTIQLIVLLHLFHDSPDLVKNFYWRLTTAFVKSNEIMFSAFSSSSQESDQVNL